jgi:hypothetical protein
MVVVQCTMDVIMSCTLQRAEWPLGWIAVSRHVDCHDTQWTGG